MNPPCTLSHSADRVPLSRRGRVPGTYSLHTRDATFRACAWAEDAPARCPPMTALTRRRALADNVTVGVLGYGRLGAVVASHAAVVGLRVIATNRHGPFVPRPPDLAWFGDDNDKLFRESDFVVCSVGDAVRGIINSTSLGLMRSSAVLIPTNPGHVDYAALYDALASRRIGCVT